MPARVVDGGEKRGPRFGAGPARPQPSSRGPPGGSPPAGNRTGQQSRGVDPRTQVRLLRIMLDTDSLCAVAGCHDGEDRLALQQAGSRLSAARRCTDEHRVRVG